MKKYIQSIVRLPLADRLSAGIWVAAVAFRVWGAWVSRCITEPDPTVVALMARHMAALKEFPIFFYGQAYMGSLEPMASALMVRLMGPTGFAVALGPVLFAAAALFFLWRWARDAAGPWGGVAALVAGCFGPAAYFQFQMAARGGYMVALFVDAAVLWMAARIAAQLRGGIRVSWRRTGVIGFLAGIGVWSNLIVAPALGVAALLILHGMRWKFWKYPVAIFSGLSGVLVGLIPWLIYNAQHEWASLAMSQIGGHAPPYEAILNSWNRFLLLQASGPLEAGAVLPWVLAIGMLGLAAIGVGLTVRQVRTSGLRSTYARAAAVLFCTAFIWVFVTSGFTRTRTARYWLPLVPGLVVLMATACGATGRRGRQAAAWTLLCGLTAAQAAQSISQMVATGRKVETCEASFREMGTVLDQTGCEALMASLQLYALNVALDERIAVSDGKQKFYEPILRRVELAEAPAYCSDFNGIETFLRQQGATWDSIPAIGRSILWNVRRPELLLREVSDPRALSLRDASGTDLKKCLLDRNLDTWWSPEASDAATLEWRFDGPQDEYGFYEPQDVQAIQLVFAHSMADEAFDFARRIRIEAQVKKEWKTVLADSPIIPLEWSGKRVYFPSGLARLEYRIDVQQAEALRVTLLDTRAQAGRVPWRLAEAAVFTLASAGTDTTIDIGIERLVRSDLTAAIYAPRWFSLELLRRGVVTDKQLAGLAPRVFGTSEEMPEEGRVNPDRNTMILVEPRFAGLTRWALESMTRDFQESSTGFWTLYTVLAGAWNADGLGLQPAVVWTGDTLMQGNTATRAGEALRRLQEGGDPKDVQEDLLREIMKWRPSALSGLSEEETRRLGGDEAVRTRQAAGCTPPVPCVTEFANGIRLEGIDIEPEILTPGGDVTVRLFWSATADFEAGQEIVFIHLRDADGEILAQDDYHGSPLLWGRDTVRPVAGEGVEELRRIALPKTLPSGMVSLSVGLYQPQNGRRVKVLHSEAPDLHRNAATWPDCLQTAP